MKTIVTYFSATGKTKRLAETFSNVLNAELFEIKPAVPYTKKDLNWLNPKSRSSVEMKDKSSRPEITDSFYDAIQEADTIFVGFPIWWYIAPTIVNTFLEQYDLSDKMIIPFATSGGSGMGETNFYLAPSCPGALLVEGKVFKSKAGSEELTGWLKELNVMM